MWGYDLVVLSIRYLIIFYPDADRRYETPQVEQLLVVQVWQESSLAEPEPFDTPIWTEPKFLSIFFPRHFGQRSLERSSSKPIYFSKAWPHLQHIKS
jgi:hypothetical protein